jgi:CheY-like chemotaxis protein
MDCQMPILDGYGATSAIRRQEGAERHTIVIAMTANAMKEDRERCLAAGMDDYLSKPVRKEELALTLERWLTPPIDLKHLNGICGDDLEFEQELLQTYLEDAQGNFDRAQVAQQQQDLPTLKALAHQLKGSSANVGATVMYKLAARLEEVAQDAAAAARHLQEMETALTHVRAYIEKR